MGSLGVHKSGSGVWILFWGEWQKVITGVLRTYHHGVH